MSLKSNYERKRAAWQEGVAHVTLDPDGPGVARLHLVPPKPYFFKDPPSLLIINGTWFLPVGPSWSALLRVFFNELQFYCKDKREITPEEIELIEKGVVTKVIGLYPKTDPAMIKNDLKNIVTIAVNIATNQKVPEEIGMGFNLEQYNKFMTAPHRMDLIVAPMSVKGKRSCPLNCACCYADSGQIMDIESSLSTDEWKEIIDKCREAGIPMLTFTGGEPLTRPDIALLVNHARWFVTRLNTNAYLLTPELAKALREASLDGIQITLYSHDPKIHDDLVGKQGAFDRTVEGIKNALNAGLAVSVNTPIVLRNKDYDNTLRFLKSLGVGCVTCSSLIPTGGAVEQITEGNYLTQEELLQILKAAVALCNKFHMDISFTSPGWVASEELLSLGLLSSPVCGACLSNMAVAPNGEVVPCQSWLNGRTLGNIRTMSWKKIWNNPDGRSIRKKYAGKCCCGLKEENKK